MPAAESFYTALHAQQTAISKGIPRRLPARARDYCLLTVLPIAVTNTKGSGLVVGNVSARIELVIAGSRGGGVEVILAV